jgi:hypothetical protein
MSTATLANGVALLRAEYKLRLVTTQEEGEALAHLPGGVYGFTASPGCSAMPVFAKPSYGGFEVQKLPDGTEKLLGYMKPDDAEQYEQGREVEGMLYPAAYGEARQLVAIDVARIVPTTRTPREDGNGLRLTINAA